MYSDWYRYTGDDLCYGVALCLVMKRDSDVYRYASWVGLLSYAWKRMARIE